MCMEKENLKKIEGFEDYAISNTGKVMNLKTGYFLSTYKVNGYERVKLIDKYGKSKSFLVHRLVGFAFVPGYFEGAEIDHINRVRNDNRTENLRWVTRKENLKNRDLTLRRYTRKGEHPSVILKKWKKEICLAMYDNRLSLEANIEEINDYVKLEMLGVFTINERTLKTYLKEEGLPVKKIDEVKMLYNNGELTLDILETYKDCIGINQYYNFKKLIKNS